MNTRFETAALLAALLLPFSCAKSTSPMMPGAATGHEASTHDAAGMWYCPMHPSYRSDKPGDCPICNMALVPLQDGVATEDSGSSGRAAVTITPERQQLIGVRTTEVVRTDFKRTIRASGIVEVDEHTLSTVSLKFGGWIEELYLKAGGETVKKGDPILAIWSPDLYEAQKSFLIARSVGSDQRSLEIARQKLRLWDMTDEQIEALAEKSDPDKRAILLSKVQGVVTRREAVVGSFVEPGTTLYDIADLGTVWVQAGVYESEMGLVKVGQTAQVEVVSAPGQDFSGRVVLVYPILDPATRTARVRIAVDNQSGELSPGMYATVLIAVDLGQQVSIDDDAVIDTGTRQIAFVEAGPGRFEPREVVLGTRSAGRAVVLKGLMPGERVVSSANFLVDSESRLRAALLQHAPASHVGGHEQH